MSLNMNWFWHHVRVLGKLKVNFLFTASGSKRSLPYRRTEDLVSLFAEMVIQFPSKTVIMPSFQHVSPQNQPVERRRLCEWPKFINNYSSSIQPVPFHEWCLSKCSQLLNWWCPCLCCHIHVYYQLSEVILKIACVGLCPMNIVIHVP